ncbi:Variant surface glycoprotein [Trypanosoma congolense IL3000]|uniref:Variant surface glycoprotein n=1 Tax=Trypanosoma congolense (strain IL3000) TaxID=1068625 RepID=F9WD09_TRYCI|nr:Variant surface glycoprotein [Trypanosoma congolense IL3000]
MKLKCLILVVMCLVVRAEESGKKDHNGDAHNALCALLKAAVTKWGNGGQDLSEPLKKALGRTLFGNERGGDVTSLKGDLPEDYKNEEGKLPLRFTWCGRPLEGATEKKNAWWPGHSAPHDLVCLCTTGKTGYPFNDVGSGSGTDTKLCGQPKEALGGGSDGWASSGGTIQQINATWVNITQKCLEAAKNGKNLKDALGDFLKKLKKAPREKYPERYQLGEGTSDEYACGGGGTICVMYYNDTTVTQQQHAIPWWTELEEAINNQAYTEQEQKKSEEKPKKEGQNQHHTQKHENTQPQQAPRTAALKQATPDKQGAEQENPENISNPIATLEDTSGTVIIPPCIWFLNALLFI